MRATLEQLESFHVFARERIASGNDLRTLEELYDHWRAEWEREDTIREIKLSLEQFERGECLTLEEVDRRIRRRFGLPLPVR